MTDIPHRDLSDRLLGAAFAVHNALGPGLLERVYENALCIEFSRLGIPFERQKAYSVYYCGQLAGEYFADLVIADSIIVEIKAVNAFTPVMSAQLLHYLRISGIPVGYLINFHSERVEWKRFALGP